MSCLSKIGVQFWPPSVVFQTPPATAPKYQVSGSPGTPWIASARPPRNGPICRHCIPLKSFSSIEPGGSGFFSGVAAGVAVPPPPVFVFIGLGSTAFEDCKIDSVKIENKKERRNRVIIRVVWKVQRAVQLESRVIDFPWLGLQGCKQSPPRALPVSNSRDATCRSQSSANRRANISRSA